MEPLYLICGLVAVGVFVQWVAARLHLPAIVLLLGAGLLVGPGLDLVEPDETFGDLLRPFISIAVALILFEGGITLRFAEVRKLGAPLVALVLGGLVVTFAGSTAAAHWVAGLSWETSSVLGAILIITGPTVVKPMLRQARVQRRPALLLKWESIVNDPLGALVAVVALEIAIHGLDQLGYVLLLILVAGAVGLVAGVILGQGLRAGSIPEHLKTPCIVGAALGVFAGAEALFHEAGLLAVTISGIVLANTRSASVEDVRQFKEEVATILVSVLFIVVSARLEFSDLTSISLGAIVFVLLVVFAIRPAVGFGALAPTGLPWREKLYLGWLAPRGVVAAAMGGALAPRLIEEGYEDARMIVPVLFAVILATVVLHGLTAAPLARRLGLSGGGGGGLLVVGATNWAIDMAQVLMKEGVEVILVDSNYRNTSQARMRGVEAFHGNVLDEETLDELPLERVTWVFAATGDDHFNSLACLAFVKAIGREQVLQLPPSASSSTEEETHLTGRRPWSESVTFGALSARYWGKGKFKCTRLDEDEHDWSDFLAVNPGAIPLFTLDERGLAPIESHVLDDLEDEESETEEPRETALSIRGDRVLYLSA